MLHYFNRTFTVATLKYALKILKYLIVSIFKVFFAHQPKDKSAMLVGLELLSNVVIKILMQHYNLAFNSTAVNALCCYVLQKNTPTNFELNV